MSASKQTEDKAEDPNVLGAKLIKAELMGDEEMVKSLKERLEKARKLAEEKKSQEQQNRQSKPETETTHKHHNHPGKSHNNQRNNQSQQRHFDRKQLDPVDSSVFNKKYKHNPNDEYDDLGPARKSSDNSKEKEEKFSDKCEFCFDNAQKHLVVSVGKYCYIRLPSNESLVEGTCMIIPMSHCKSSVVCDEEILNEIKEFKQALVKMFDAKRMECIFIEQYYDNNYSHLVIECIPLGLHVSDLGPIYFKKAILESESEWAQNKSLINLKNQEIRKLIPKNMPYFAVNFGLEEGYAHVIENSEAFPEHFAKEIIGGILDLDPFLWRRPQREDFAHQSKKVIEFLKWWKNYDLNKK